MVFPFTVHNFSNHSKQTTILATSPFHHCLLSLTDLASYSSSARATSPSGANLLICRNYILPKFASSPSAGHPLMWSLSWFSSFLHVLHAIMRSGKSQGICIFFHPAHSWVTVRSSRKSRRTPFHAVITDMADTGLPASGFNWPTFHQQ